VGTAAVLYVEDDPVDVLLMERVWRRVGLLNPLHIVSDGQSALDYLAGAGPYADRAIHPLPVLVLLDIKVPKLTGLQVLQWIRHHPTLSALRVVILSSSRIRRDTDEASALGVCEFLVKPSDFKVLEQMIADLRDRWLEPASLDALFADFAAEGDARLTRDGVAHADRLMLRSVDLRYHGQSFELSVTVPPSPLSAADIDRMPAEFHASHERAYGYSAPDDPVELVNVRLAAVGVTPKPRRAPLAEGGRSAAAAVKGRRDVWFAEANGFRETVVLDRAKLLRGNVIEGPAMIEEHDASTLVHPGWKATVDEHANLVLRP